MFRLFGEKTEQTSKRVRCIDDFIESAAVCIFNRHFVEVTFYNVVKFLYSYIVNKSPPPSFVFLWFSVYLSVSLRLKFWNPLKILCTT